MAISNLNGGGADAPTYDSSVPWTRLAKFLADERILAALVDGQRGYPHSEYVRELIRKDHDHDYYLSEAREKTALAFVDALERLWPHRSLSGDRFRWR